MTAEEVAEALPFTEAVDHPVDTGLEHSDLAAVVDADVGPEVAVVDPPHGPADLVDGFGQRSCDESGGDRPRDQPDACEHHDRGGEPHRRR